MIDDDVLFVDPILGEVTETEVEEVMHRVYEVDPGELSNREELVAQALADYGLEDRQGLIEWIYQVADSNDERHVLYTELIAYP